MPVRRATIDDAAGIAHVHVTSWQDAYRGLLPADFLNNLSVERRSQQWENILQVSHGHTLIYEHVNPDGGRQIVGFAGLGACRDADFDSQITGEIYAIYVTSAHWGSGYGAALMQASIELLQKLSFKAVTLWVLQDNQRAIRFYARANFVADGHTKTETLPGDVAVTEIRYWRTI
ncbi:MAG: GNAT family N-acetyltransferase [Caldilineaceae bacterium]